MASDDNYDIPYVPSSDDRLEIMLKFAKAGAGDNSLDLGAGDGRVVIAMAKAGARALGLEIDSERAKLAQDRLKKAGLARQAKIEQANFWDHNLGPYDIITVFGIRSIMPALEKKILAEAKSGARIVCNYFYFPNLVPAKVENFVLLYIKD
ncbi:MAG TPA: class I SAM-dependent methyltransferase [Candidatus Saccharimonadales bacterium]|nr:class I SAM-dependent methyltransferase [Candidatus Saccharimonadales bacterium]